MARITFGLATSHSPMLNVPVESWPEYAGKDANLLKFLGENLFDEHGEIRSYEEMLELNKDDARLAAEIAPAKLEERYNACQSANDKCAAALAKANVDVVVVIGNDHKDFFSHGTLPALAIYCGDTITNIMPPRIASLPPAATLGARAWYDNEPTDYPGHSELGNHLVKFLTADGFDIATITEMQEEQGMAHAFTHIHKRLMTDKPIPMVPVFINTFYPPNQPTPKRCYELGLAIRRAIESMDSDERVGIMCSGGLSHFVVQEDLDRLLLKAIAERDVDTLVSLPVNRLESGNSELRNWITAAAAAENLNFELVDYVPCYRTMAGTGCGMAFATWE